MMLADFGAEVTAIRRPGKVNAFDPSEGMQRGKHNMDVDLKTAEGVALVRQLAAMADVFLESSRPGVMERLGLGPDLLLADNPRLIYTRLTGWGQSGPYSAKAGHDLNYLAISGALGVSGQDRPTVPPAMFGDISNGSYMAAFGIVAALFDRVGTGKGQIVDAAICDGAAFGMAGIFSEMKSGMFSGELGTHVLSGHAPFYRSYRCADGKWYSVGAIEPQFYAAFLGAMGLEDVDPSPHAQWSTAEWDSLRARLDVQFATESRDAWAQRFADVDACTAPVLNVDELDSDPHLRARGTIIRQKDGSLRSAPAPRLSAYPDLYDVGHPRDSKTDVKEVGEAQPSVATA